MTIERKKDLFVLLIGLVGGIRIRMMGTFYLSEILIFLSYYFVSWKVFADNRYVRRLMLLALLWLLGCLISDTVNLTSSSDALKGAFNIIFFILQIPITYWALADKPSRYLQYILGSGFSSVPSFLFFGSIKNGRVESLPVFDDIWFYYSLAPLAIAVISYLYYKQSLSKIIIYIISLSFGLFMLFNNSRNIFLTMSMSVILLAYIDHCHTDSLADTVKKYRNHLLRLFMCLFVGLLVMDEVYEHLASEGILGEYAYNKYMMQKNSKDGLVSARKDTYMGIELIINKPLWGYGSYAKDKGDRFHQQYSIRHKTEYEIPEEEKYLPGHSHIVGYWLNHGVLGGLFWIYVLLLMWKVFRSGAIFEEPRLMCLFIMTFTSKLWDILFSPFGNRVGMAFFLCYVAILSKTFLKKRINRRLYGTPYSIRKHYNR